MIPILSSILPIINKFIPNPDKQAEVKMALAKEETKIEGMFVEYAKQDHEMRMKEIEAKGFKAAWRPSIMFGLSFIIVLYLFMYYIVPQFIVVFNINTYYLQPIQIPDIVWHVFAYCILGIGGLRTIEKTVRIWKK